ncbi:MAG: LLM class flavin-dependent oxidoreductase, partial [Candidatus Dormibacteraeota bacterium]|nr:LLM class flavin-dependent oxidoreductase [Candidatus Dormibacteraeota bacterium]
RAFRLEPGMRLLYPRRRPAVPLLLGGWGPRVTALAGEIAVELKIGGTANPHLVARARERLGATPTRIVIGAVTVVDHDGAAARARARRHAAVYVDVVGGLDPTLEVDPDLLSRLRQALRRGDIDRAVALLDDDLLDAFALAGTPSEVAEHAARLVSAGAHRIDFGPPLGLEGPQRGAELLAREVLPALR